MSVNNDVGYHGFPDGRRLYVSTDSGSNEVHHGYAVAGSLFRIQNQGSYKILRDKKMNLTQGMEIAEAIVLQSKRTEIPVKMFIVYTEIGAQFFIVRII
jgi:hypothetical protein